MIENKKAIIIVAGGKGTRMGVSLPKQFLVLGGKPILMHTIERFYGYDSNMKIVLVLPADQHDYWMELCVQYKFTTPVELAEGGETRFHSVKNGLSLITTEKWVGVHDGVRPFVSLDVLTDAYEQVQTVLAVVPTIDVYETLRRKQGESSVTVNRAEYQLVQTPQVFETALLKRAYDTEFDPHFTDDASVVEALGVPVVCISGNRENIKLTTPFDLKIGEALFEC